MSRSPLDLLWGYGDKNGANIATRMYKTIMISEIFPGSDNADQRPKRPGPAINFFFIGIPT